MEPTKELLQAVKEYREGKKEAFTPLYEASHKYIYTCIRKVVGDGGNMQDAVSDIMQDTYVEISRNITQLDREESFLSWAGTIATRKCYAWLKKNRKYVLLSEEDGLFENLADDENIIPEEVMQDREKQRLVREIVEMQLTEMQKICVVAYYYNEQKQSEIARELGISENTVKTNLARAKAKIKAGVLDLEKKQGTRLYGVAPLLLLLFREDMYACVVPKSITAGVSNAVAAAGGIGRKTLFGKLASVSLKAKVAVGVIGAGVTILIVGNTYIYIRNKEEAMLYNRQNPIQTETDQEQNPDEGSQEETTSAQDAETEQSNQAATGEESEAEPDAVQEPVEVTLSEQEQQDLEMLISLLTLNSYFFGGMAEEYRYPADDMGMLVTMMNIAGSFSTQDAAYAEYLPQMELHMDEYMGYSDVTEIQSYVKNVFGVENADLSAYSEGGKVAFLLYLDRQRSEVSIDTVKADADGVYEIAGNASVIEFGPTVYTFSYALTVIKNDDSVFGFQVLSLEYREM